MRETLHLAAGDRVEFLIAHDGAVRLQEVPERSSELQALEATLAPEWSSDPALVCSSVAFNRQARHVVLAMITTSTHSAWPDDVPIQDLDAAGLPAPSVVRWKLFTLDASFVLRRAGGEGRHASRDDERRPSRTSQERRFL